MQQGLARVEAAQRDTVAERHAQAAVQRPPSTPAEEPEAAAPATVGGRPVSRALFAGAAEGAAQIDSPHVPRPPPPRPDSAARR